MKRWPLLSLVWLISILGAFSLGRFRGEEKAGWKGPESRALESQVETVPAVRNAPDTFPAVFPTSPGTVGDWAAAYGAAALMDHDTVEHALGLLEAQRPSRARDELKQTLWRRLAELDPQRAAERAAGIAGIRERDETLALIAGIWAAGDLDAAWIWVDREAGGRWSAFRIYSSLLASIRQSRGLDAMLEHYLSMPDGSHKATLVSEIARAVARDDPGKLADLVLGFSDEQLSQQAVAASAEALGRIDPEAALEWILDLPPSRRQDSVRRVLGQWARSEDAEAAVAFVRRQPAGPETDAMKRMLAVQLGSIRTGDALALTTELSDASERDLALRNVISNLRRSGQLALAVESLEQFPTGTTRDGIVFSIYHAMRSADPDAAEAFLLTTPHLAEEQRRQFLEGLARTRP